MEKIRLHIKEAMLLKMRNALSHARNLPVDQLY